jgi:preprotein translocase subunit SecB
VPPDRLQPVIAIHCPTVLFPYVRETIAAATTRAGYPPVHLAPINFEALYAQQMAQMQAQPAVAGSVN